MTQSSCQCLLPKTPGTGWNPVLRVLGGLCIDTRSHLCLPTPTLKPPVPCWWPLFIGVFLLYQSVSQMQRGLSPPPLPSPSSGVGHIDSTIVTDSRETHNVNGSEKSSGGFQELLPKTGYFPLDLDFMVVRLELSGQSASQRDKRTP